MHSGFLLKDENKKSFHLIFFLFNNWWKQEKAANLSFSFPISVLWYSITIHGKIVKPHHLKIAGEKG